MRGGRVGGGQKRLKQEAIKQETPSQYIIASNRDSDASYATNRPSSSLGCMSNVPITDRSYQSSAIRAIRNYLSLYSKPYFNKPPPPSAKDITDTIRFLITQFDWPSNSGKLEDDLPSLLKFMNCPIKLNKSALKAPGTPHAWPSLLGVIYWLVQIAQYSDHKLNSSATANTSNHSFFQDNELLMYGLESYSYFISGDDDSVDKLDKKFVDKLAAKNDAEAEEVSEMEKEVFNLDEKLQAMRSDLSAKEKLEKEKAMLEEDIRKFHALIDGFKCNIMELEKGLERMEKELEMKNSENQRIIEENMELKKFLESQMFNSRDVERIRRDIQALEREISEAETARNEWEEKSWDVDAFLGKKYKELENLSVECNQAIRRLKIGDDLQYKLNSKGSKPADILGVDDISLLKNTLIAFANDLNKSSMAKLEEFISLQQQSQDKDSKLKEKRSLLTKFLSRIDAVESQLSVVEKEIQEYASMCSAEAKRITEDLEQEMHKLDKREREADEFLKTTSAKLQDLIKKNDEEIQKCAHELFILVDSVSKYKESMESTLLNIRRDVSETAEAITNVYKGSLAAELVNV